MVLKITNKDEKPLFSRKEIDAEITFKGAIPSRKELKQELAKQLSVDDSLIVISKIEPRYGKGSAAVKANVYKDKKVMSELESQYFLDRDAGKKKAPKEGAKREEKKEEGKKEEAPKEEPKKEAEAPPTKKEETKKKTEQKEEKPKSKEKSKPEEKKG